MKQSNKKIKVVDLFAGAGGLSYGFAKDEEFEIVMANEYDPVIADTYIANHPETLMINKDIALIKDKEFKGLGEVDVVIGGPPCQSYSTLGKRELDKRANLFREYFRAIKNIKPKIFIYENVKGLLTMNKKQLLPDIIELFESEGYDVKFKLLNAADYGVPQTRKRLIIVGTEPGYEFTHPLKSVEEWSTFNDATSDLVKLSHGEGTSIYASKPNNNLQKFYRSRKNKSVSEHFSKDFPAKMKKLMETLDEGGTKKTLPADLRPKGGFGNSYSKLWSDRPSTTITRNFTVPSSARCIHPTQSRALSIREGARLQSFPDDYIFIGTDSKKRLAIGNAVPPLMSIQIAKEVKKTFKNKK